MDKKICKLLTITLVGVVSFCLGISQTFSADKPQGYPSRNIEVINPWKAGGSTDLYVRTLANPLEKLIGRKVVIINEEGGEGVRAFREVESRPADGYTLFAIGPEEVINSVYGRVDYKHLSPVVRVQMDQSMFWVKEDSRFRTFKDLVDFAKANPNKLMVGGGYGIDQVVTSLLSDAAGMKVRFVPFGVGKEATAALLGGHVDVLHEEPGGIISQIQAKMARPLIVLSEKRISEFSDTPTGKELGYDITLGRWRGIAARKGTPTVIIKYLAETILEATKSPEYQKLAEKTLMNLRPGYLAPEEFGKFLDTEFTVYSKEMRKIGLVK